MREKEFSVSYKILSKNELNESQIRAIKVAENAVKNAYSPYSNYQVGAALYLENGEIVPGNNQENAVYPLGLCAERVALFNSGALYPNVKPKLLALTIASENKPGFPCGSCRQALIEFESRYKCEIPILIESKNNEFILFDTVKDILPFAFDKTSLDN